jgi:hypothetical protein
MSAQLARDVEPGAAQRLLAEQPVLGVGCAGFTVLARFGPASAPPKKRL